MILLATMISCSNNKKEVQTQEVDSLAIELRKELQEIDRYYQIEIMNKKDSLFNAYNSKTTEEQAE